MNAIPSDAATIILLRPCPDATVGEIEVLMVLRNRKSHFVPGYFVFPGGVLDPEDYEPGIERFIRGINREQAARVLHDMSDPRKAIGAWVAAIRETFEETGVLIAERKDGSPVSIETTKERERFGRYRSALIRRGCTFTQMLEAENIVLSVDPLHYFSHWITPEPLPRRYDVRFFAAAAPKGQSVAHDGIELTGHIWLRPSLALEDYERGRMGMVLPQLMTLAEISRFKTVGEVLAFAKQRDVSATLTRIRRIDGRDVEVMPDGTPFGKRPPVYP